MYGMIHRGLRALVIEELGEAQWRDCEHQAGLGAGEFISVRVYDDEVTFNLVQIVAVRLGLSIEECLRKFGAYWIRFTADGPYGAMMRFTGRDITSFIGNLDRMHQSVLMAMPEARVPSFSIVDKAEGLVRVRYASERDGLEPLVAGLFEGLLQRFELQGSVEQVDCQGKDPEFLVRYHAKDGGP